MAISTLIKQCSPLCSAPAWSRSPTSSSITATDRPGWADFKNPNWGTWAITRDDNAFTDRASEVVQHAGRQTRRAEKKPQSLHAARWNDLPIRLVPRHRPYERAACAAISSATCCSSRAWAIAVGATTWCTAITRAGSRFTIALRRQAFSVGEYDWDKQGGTAGLGLAYCDERPITSTRRATYSISPPSSRSRIRSRHRTIARSTAWAWDRPRRR